MVKLVKPAPAVVLEGDYSDWAVYDSFDDSYVWNGLFYQYGVVNRVETIITLILRELIAVRKYTIATKTVGAIDEEYIHPGVFASPDADPGTAISIQGTYVVALVRVAGVTTGGNGVAIWKNGVLIKTLTTADLGLDTNEVNSASISKSGKYLVVSGLRTATGNRGWVILVGS